MALRSRMTSQKNGSKHTVTITASAKGGSKSQVEIGWTDSELSSPEDISPPTDHVSAGLVKWLVDLTGEELDFQVTLTCAANGQHLVAGSVKLADGTAHSMSTGAGC